MFSWSRLISYTTPLYLGRTIVLWLCFRIAYWIYSITRSIDLQKYKSKDALQNWVLVTGGSDGIGLALTKVSTQFLFSFYR